MLHAELRGELLERRVVELVAQCLEDRDAEVTLDSRLVEDLDVDSFTAVMILRALEDELSLSLDDGFIPRIRTVGDIVGELRQMDAVGAAEP